MARDSGIIVSSNPKGVFLTGIIDGTDKPGTIMKVKPATARVGNNFTYVAFTGTDGLKALCAVLMDDQKNGRLATTAYVDEEPVQMYVPISGEEVNVLVGETAGTANTYAIGDRLILEGTSPAGTLFLETGTPQDTPFICMEAFTQQAAQRLTWCMKT